MTTQRGSRCAIKNAFTAVRPPHAKQFLSIRRGYPPRHPFPVGVATDTAVLNRYMYVLVNVDYVGIQATAPFILPFFRQHAGTLFCFSFLSGA